MWLNHYLLIRHTPNGRKYPFLDCWGLVCEFYRRECFFEIDTPHSEFGDVIAFFRHGLIFHVAVYLGKGEMLHTGLNRHCRVEKIRAMQFVESRFYRHAGVLESRNR